MIQLSPKTKSWTVFDLINTCLIISFTHLNFSSERRQSTAQHKLFLSFVVKCRTKLPCTAPTSPQLEGRSLGAFFKCQCYCTSVGRHSPACWWRVKPLLRVASELQLDVLVTFGLELSNIVVSTIYLIVKLLCWEIRIPLPRRKDAETSWNVGYINIEEEKKKSFNCRMYPWKSVWSLFLSPKENLLRLFGATSTFRIWEIVSSYINPWGEETVSLFYCCTHLKKVCSGLTSCCQWSVLAVIVAMLTSEVLHVN